MKKKKQSEETRKKKMKSETKYEGGGGGGGNRNRGIVSPLTERMESTLQGVAALSQGKHVKRSTAIN